METQFIRLGVQPAPAEYSRLSLFENILFAGSGYYPSHFGPVRNADLGKKKRFAGRRVFKIDSSTMYFLTQELWNYFHNTM